MEEGNEGGVWLLSGGEGGGRMRMKGKKGMS